ncbi:MAG: hypothetical protein CSA42_05385 [Gammaproteobacteria bacterium]|nr:MAG: hypothetical protein CSA42_05385 [Gammaproteobacteria bacterium]
MKESIKRTAILLMFISCQAIAGGSSSPVKVTSFIHDDTNIMAYEMKLITHDDGTNWKISEFDNCDEITVKGFYDYQRWKNYRRPMTAKTHRQSIAYLITAMETDKPIYFGTIGMGLIKKSHCTFESRGLFRGCGTEVFSVNGRI